jgi:hypothetical protein
MEQPLEIGRWLPARGVSENPVYVLANLCSHYTLTFTKHKRKVYRFVNFSGVSRSGTAILV